MWRYRCTTEEFDRVCRELREKLSNGTWDHREETAALFALYSAEWWRRSYSGGPWGWGPVGTALGLPKADRERFNELGRDGLRFWRRDVRQTARGREVLATLAGEGGMPLALVRQESSSHFRDFLIALAKDLDGIDSAVLDNELAAVEPLAVRGRAIWDNLPGAHRQGEIMAQAGILACLTVQFLRQNGGVLPADTLEQLRRPEWESRFPIDLDDGEALDLLGIVLTELSRSAAHRRRQNGVGPSDQPDLRWMWAFRPAGQGRWRMERTLLAEANLSHATAGALLGKPPDDHVKRMSIWARYEGDLGTASTWLGELVRVSENAWRWECRNPLGADAWLADVELAVSHQGAQQRSCGISVVPGRLDSSRPIAFRFDEDGNLVFTGQGSVNAPSSQVWLWAPSGVEVLGDARVADAVEGRHLPPPHDGSGPAGTWWHVTGRSTVLGPGGPWQIATSLPTLRRTAALLSAPVIAVPGIRTLVYTRVPVAADPQTWTVTPATMGWGQIELQVACCRPDRAVVGKSVVRIAPQGLFATCELIQDSVTATILADADQISVARARLGGVRGEWVTLTRAQVGEFVGRLGLMATVSTPTIRVQFQLEGFNRERLDFDFDATPRHPVIVDFDGRVVARPGMDGEIPDSRLRGHRALAFLGRRQCLNILAEMDIGSTILSRLMAGPPAQSDAEQADLDLGDVRQNLVPMWAAAPVGTRGKIKLTVDAPGQASVAIEVVPVNGQLRIDAVSRTVTMSGTGKLARIEAFRLDDPSVTCAFGEQSDPDRPTETSWLLPEEMAEGPWLVSAVDSAGYYTRWPACWSSAPPRGVGPTDEGLRAAIRSSDPDRPVRIRAALGSLVRQPTGRTAEQAWSIIEFSARRASKLPPRSLNTISALASVPDALVAAFLLCDAEARTDWLGVLRAEGLQPVLISVEAALRGLHAAWHVYRRRGESRPSFLAEVVSSDPLRRAIGEGIRTFPSLDAAVRSWAAAAPTRCRELRTWRDVVAPAKEDTAPLADRATVPPGTPGVRRRFLPDSTPPVRVGFAGPPDAHVQQGLRDLKGLLKKVLTATCRLPAAERNETARIEEALQAAVAVGARIETVRDVFPAALALSARFDLLRDAPPTPAERLALDEMRSNYPDGEDALDRRVRQELGRLRPYFFTWTEEPKSSHGAP